MKILNMFYLLICVHCTQKVHKDFIFLCSIVLPPVGHSSNHDYHCCQLTRQSSWLEFFIALLKFSFDSPSYTIMENQKKNSELATRVPLLRVSLGVQCSDS